MIAAQNGKFALFFSGKKGFILLPPETVSPKRVRLCVLLQAVSSLASSYPHGAVRQIHTPPPSSLFLLGIVFLGMANLAIQLAIIGGLDYEIGPKGNAPEEVSLLCPTSHSCQM